MTTSEQTLAQTASELIGPTLDKIYNVSTGRKYQKLRQSAKELLDGLESLLCASLAKPAGKAKKAAPQQTPTPAAPQTSSATDSSEDNVRLLYSEADGFKLVVVPVNPATPSELEPPIPAAHEEPTEDHSEPSVASEDKGHFEQLGNGHATEDFQILPAPVGLDHKAAMAVLALLRGAVETRRPPIVEVALDCIQKMVAHKLLTGPVHHINHRRESASAKLQPKKSATGDEEEETSAVDSEKLPPQAQAIELLCLCDDVPDEVVERRVLKGLLTAMTSTSVFVHGQALLLAVRACYNIFLMSRDDTNRVTAKATLTQMVNVVFQRMEAGDFVLVKPIAVTDVLGLPPSDGNSMSASVQNFLHEVMSHVDVSGNYVGNYVEGIQRRLDTAFAPQSNANDYSPRSEPPDSPDRDKIEWRSNGPNGRAHYGQEAPEAKGKSEEISSVAATDGGESHSIIDNVPIASPPEQTQDTEVEVAPSATTSSEATAVAAESTEPPAADVPVASLPSIDTSHLSVVTGTAPPMVTSQAHDEAGRSPVPSVVSIQSMQRRQSLLQKDAFLVFRALCKLSIKTADSTTINDQTIVRGKELALELLKIVLENSGDVFRSSDKFINAIKQYLCLSLLKNCSSNVPQVLRLSSSIFLTLLIKFRQSLKAEIGLFFPMILLRPIEPAAAGTTPNTAAASGVITGVDVAHKHVVMKCLEGQTVDGQLLVDLFVNYDCDLEGANLFERMIAALVRIAQGGHVEQPGQLTADEKMLRTQALRCLVNTLIALVQWYAKSSETNNEFPTAPTERLAHTKTLSSNNLLSPNAASSDQKPFARSATQTEGGEDAKEVEPSIQSFDEQTFAGTQLADILKRTVPPGTDADAAQAQLLESFKLYKKSFQQSLALFNQKPKKGLAVLQEQGFVGTSPEEIARFLAKTQGLDKTMIGEYMGEKDDLSIKVMHAYTDAMDFTSMEFDESLRKYLEGFRLPGEAQKIDRFMLKFAERYVNCNPNTFASANVAYVLSYAVIMLNTDAHNPMVKKKMSKQDFLRNIRGINEGSDLNEQYMTQLYDRIVNNEIKFKDDFMGTGQQSVQTQQSQGLLAAIMGLIPGRKQQATNEPSDEAIKRTHDYLRERAKGATFFVTSDGETARPMLDISWAPMLGAFSVNFEEFEDDDMSTLCLAGFRAAIRLECLLGMTMLRNTYLSSLGRFTMLHSPGAMKIKNARAFKTLLLVAEENGNSLQECWEDVLRCISRFELLQQLSAGLPTDAYLFAPPSTQEPKKAEGFSERLQSALSVGSNKLFRRDKPASGQQPQDSTAVEQGFFLYLKGGKTKDNEVQIPPVEVLAEIDKDRLDALFVQSDQLDSEAVVEFVRILCKIAQEELKSVQSPRVFSLTKIVEISHFNMSRIRIVWSRIWSILADFFIEVGCHKNLQVAMYAVDSLRQLSMKFLERDELANYTFQNDFLRPFVFVMRQSRSVEIRELIIRCVSQMILARVSNVKSGWKSMFMVFTTAANDEQPQVVRLAFDTIEKIVREYFEHITETEKTTFTDCVNCLIAFTNNPHSLDVSLNAIAFLRYCAIQLAEGEIALNESESVPADGQYGKNIFRVKDLMTEDTQAWSAEMSSNWDDRFKSEKNVQLQASQAQAMEALKQGGEQQERLEGSASVSSFTSSKRMRFTDKDEHMYFWFPLLAGLSELTFDPRQEIRQSALEVLFDTLEFHGHSFTAPFWTRIFDSVLLPIFDHVRAEVTDTTTFTDEKRRADVDAWLYETCTQCLQHIVDLVVKFYPVVQDLLGRILELLMGFIRRTHHSLAAVGVAALVRLIINAGVMFSEATWMEVLSGVSLVAADTLPGVGEVVNRIERANSEDSGSTSDSPGEIRSPSEIRSPANRSPRSRLGKPGSRAFSLLDGAGARRLTEVRCRASVQLLVVQACGEIYAAHSGRLSPGSAAVMLDILRNVASHARVANSDMRMRHILAWAQMTDKVPEEKQLPDPPLLRLESEGSYAYLSMLLHIRSSGSPAHQDGCQVEHRLVQLCSANLIRYECTQGGETGALNHDENVALSPLVVATLKAIAGFPGDAFKRHLKVFFPLLTQLISCDYSPPEVQKALGELFNTRIAPLLS